MERQRQHRRGIVPVEPRPLALLPAQGEEVPEDLLVRDDAGQDRDQHHDRGDTDQPARPDHRHVIKIEVEAVEELTTARVACVGGGAVSADQRLIVAATASTAPAATLPFLGLRLPHHLSAGHLCIGHGDEPALRIGRLVAEEALRAIKHPHRLFDPGKFGPHVAVQPFAPEGDRPGQENQEQHPAEQQARPSVQRRLRLPDAFAHARPTVAIDHQTSPPATAPASASTHSARHPLRAP